jgi:hypothetical protein
MGIANIPKPVFEKVVKLDLKSMDTLKVWYDGSDPLNSESPPENGSRIKTLNDKSNNNYNSIKTNGNPVYDASTKSIKFDGRSSFGLPDGSYPYGNAAYSYFIVISVATVGPAHWYISGGNSQVMGSPIVGKSVAHSWARGNSELYKVPIIVPSPN